MDPIAAPLKPEVEKVLATFVAILGGGAIAERTVRAVYQLGYMDGALRMASPEQIKDTMLELRP